ncbi:MAG: hypothetical protein OEW06_16415, partial [Gemmatimonadota bacterium]|nr:hypothetical protein [Gemmatimonadota bacterium]
MTIPGDQKTKPLRDEWITPTVEAIIGVDRLRELRDAAPKAESLWDLAVSAGGVTDEQILGALSNRFRLK